MAEKILEVRGTEYIVSDDGKVYSTKNCGRGSYHKELSQRVNRDGYMQVTVGKNDNRTQARVHRLVAEAFVPNPDNLPEVNHIDFDRKNNHASNLEWCTHKKNINYSIEAGRHVSTTMDYTGKNNPNYGNNTLRKKYREHPELAKKAQSRKDEQNGRSVKTYLLDKDKKLIKEFLTIKACVIYVRESLGLNTKVDSIVGAIHKRMNKDISYKKTYYFSKDNTVLSLSTEESATTTENIA